MKLFSVFVFLFVFPYINVAIVIFIFYRLIKKCPNKNYAFIFAKITNCNFIQLLLLLMLSILTNTSYQSKKLSLKQRISIISIINFELLEHSSKYYFQINIKHIVCYTSLHMIKVFYINVTHILLISNLYLFLKSETLLSKGINYFNSLNFNKKYYFDLYNMSITKNTGILEISIENLKNFYVGTKCKNYLTNNIIITYLKYYIKAFISQIIKERVKFSIVTWYKITKNKI